MKKEHCKVGMRVRGSMEAIKERYFHPEFVGVIADLRWPGDAVLLECGGVWDTYWLEPAAEEVVEATLKALPPYREQMVCNTGVIVDPLPGGGVRVTSKEYREAVYGNLYQGAYHYRMFKFMADNHGVHLLDSELQDIIDFVHKNYPDPDLQKAVSEVYREAEFCVRSCAPTPFPGWVMNKLSPFVHDDP